MWTEPARGVLWTDSFTHPPATRSFFHGCHCTRRIRWAGVRSPDKQTHPGFYRPPPPHLSPLCIAPARALLHSSSPLLFPPHLLHRVQGVRRREAYSLMPPSPYGNQRRQSLDNFHRHALQNPDLARFPFFSLSSTVDTFSSPASRRCKGRGCARREGSSGVAACEFSGRDEMGSHKWTERRRVSYRSL